MDKNTFEIANPILEEIDDAITELLASTETQKLRGLLSRLNTAIGSRYLVNLVMDVDIFDQDKDRCLPVLQTGMSGFDTDEPYQVSGDSTPQSYVVGGEMLTVPHDRCPKCWNVWDLKFQQQVCEHCGAAMGADVKLLLDTDECPLCGEGKVTMTDPICDKCDYEVDLDQVVWG
jgi:hypothetical protein